MSKTFRTIPLLFLLLIIAVVFLFWKNSRPNIAGKSENASFVQINGKNITVEIADTKEERDKGLGGRSELEENSGMLFVFPDGSWPVFWMKDMQFPIDIIWINNNSIIKIDKNVLPPLIGTPEYSLDRYGSFTPTGYVLEVSGGFAEKNNIKEGDTVIMEIIKTN